MDESIAPIVDELNRALGVDKEILTRELTLLIIEFKVPAEEARRSIIKKHSGEDSKDKASAAARVSEGVSQGAPAVRLLKDIRNGDGGITVIANVLEPQHREITTSKGTMTVINGMLEDATAKLHFTSWIDHEELFTAGTIVARNVYVNSFHGMPSVNIGERTTVEPFGGRIPGYSTRRRSLAELGAGDGAYDVEAEGDVVSIRPGSGLIERCPECSRVMQKGQCRAHGKVEGIWDMRIKAILDDGTGSMICVFDRTLTKALIGIEMEELLRSGGPDSADERIHESLIGLPFVVRGNVTRGEYGRILIATQASRPYDDIGRMARELMVSLR
jgi:ssDNA-binding replication factor A large subunit